VTDTLERASAGAPVRVTDINGGRDVRARLANMGLLPGVTVHVLVRGPLGGPVVVEIDGSRFAIGRGLARKVVVES